MQQKHVFGQTIFGKSFLDIYKCPFFIFPKNFPGKKHDILNNKYLEVLKETCMRHIMPTPTPTPHHILFFNHHVFGDVSDYFLFLFKIIVSRSTHGFHNNLVVLIRVSGVILCAIWMLLLKFGNESLIF